MKTLLVFICSLILSSTAFAQTFVDYYRQGVAAYEQKNYDEFLISFQKADSLRPNHRTLLYNLAVGYSLTNQPEQAIEVLNYRASFYAVNDFGEDEDFALLHGNEAYEALNFRIEDLSNEKSSSTLAFELSIDGMHTEGIAFNQHNNRFYITDIRNGWIYSVTMNGEDPTLEIDLKELGYWSAMGITLDPNNANTLWVTTAAVPNFINYSDSLSGKSAVLEIDLNKGELHQAYEIEGEHVFGDLIFSNDGNLLISDSGQPTIVKLDQNSGTLGEFISDDDWWNLQGISYSKDGNHLYVSDYITGIYKVELSTKKVEPLTKKNEFLRGSDGIYILDDHLIMLQNGTVPKRLSSIMLNDSGYGITSSINALDQALVHLDEPTLGVVVGSTLYYVANSPWAHYNEDAEPIIENWGSIRIHRLSLE